MIVHLPTGLFEDELLYSALSRSVDMMDIPTARGMLVNVFGTEAITAVIALPGRLVQASDGFLCMSDEAKPGERLLWRHTLYPYYARFVSRAVADRAMASMLGAGGAAAYGAMGVRASRVSSPRHLRYCPSCVRMDRAICGMSYWRRLHQLPGTMICTIHLEPLRFSKRLTSCARHRLAFHSLESSISDGDRPCCESDDLSWGSLLEISRRNEHILKAQVDPSDVGLCLEAWEQRRSELEKAGISRGRRQRDLSSLRSEIVGAFGTEILADIGCSPGGENSDDWVARMSRPPRRSAHPLYHALLAALLGYTTISTRSPEGDQASDVTPPGRMPALVAPSMGEAAGDASQDETLRALIADDALSLRAIARRVGVDSRTIKRRAIAMDVWRSAWRSTPDLHLGTRARDGMEERLQTARQRWLDHRHAHPSCSKAEMRKAMPARFALLYRRDRAWLDANSPARRPAGRRRKTVDWDKRDVALAGDIQAAADLLATARPARAVRPATLGRLVDRLALVQQHIHRLQATRAVLTRVCDDPLELARGRLNDAVALFARERRPTPAASVLARAASLGPTRVRQLASQIEAGRAAIELAASDVRRL